MCILAFPSLGYPNQVWIGRVIGNDVAQTTGHSRNPVEQYLHKLTAFPGVSRHLPD